MIIAINASHFIQLAGNDFFYEFFLQAAASKPEHQFIFITPSAIDARLTANHTIIHVISSPVANNPLMWKIWLDYTLPAIARKHKASMIVNIGGACSLRTRLPQCLYISDLSFLNPPCFFSKKEQYFFKKNMAAFLDKAKMIVTASDFLAKEIIRRYSIDEKKITGFQLIAGDHYQPVGWKEKEAIKEKYAEGKEYFLFSGDIHPRNNLVNLLKAFSFFKKRQKSNMQLIIASKAATANNPFIENLKTYKYRKEVIVLNGLPEKDLAEITAAAYAFVYPSQYKGMALSAVQAMQCGAPVITSNAGALPEVYGDAALYTDAENFEDIAEKMMLVFKDENKRSELIKKGLLKVQENNKEKTAGLFWKSILKTTG